MILETAICACFVRLKALVECQGNISWPVIPKGIAIESMAVTGIEHQVSVNKGLD